MTRDSNTEERILQAAEEVFQEKGYDGARMREIAERAGTNKGLLHYYFKTKDALFEAIFGMVFKRMISRMQAVLQMDMPMDSKIDLIVDQYMGFIQKNPSLPRFVLNELNKNPEQFVSRHVNKDVKEVFAEFKRMVEKEVESGKVRNIDPRQLLMNIISMIIFPFVGRPMLQVLFGAGNEEFRELLSERKELIKAFVKGALRP